MAAAHDAARRADATHRAPNSLTRTRQRCRLDRARPGPLAPQSRAIRARGFRSVSPASWGPHAARHGAGSITPPHGKSCRRWARRLN